MKIGIQMRNIRNNFRLASMRRIISDKKYEKKNNLLNKIDDFVRIAKHLVSFGIATGFLTIFWYCSIVIRWIPISISFSDTFYFIIISLLLGIIFLILLIITFLIILIIFIISCIIIYILGKLIDIDSDETDKIDIKYLSNEIKKMLAFSSILLSILIIPFLSKDIIKLSSISTPNATIQLSDSDYKLALSEAGLRNQNLNFMNNNRIHNVNILWHGIGSYALVEFPLCEENKTFRMAVKTDEIKIITPTYPKPTDCSADRSAEYPQPKRQPHVRILETANSILPPQHNNRQRRKLTPNKTTGNVHIEQTMIEIHMGNKQPTRESSHD